MLSADRLETILARFPKLRIGLVGDLFLDRYLEIDPELHELSVETGLEAYQVTRVRNSPGALGTVMNNLAALGVGKLAPVTLLGDDGEAYELLKEVQQLPADPAHIRKDPARRTPTYTKPMKRGDDGQWQELNRLDLRNRAAPSSESQSFICGCLADVFHTCDGVIVLDQVNEEGWGVITGWVRWQLADLAKEHPGKLLFIDSRANIAKFNFGVLKVNRRECLAATGRPADASQEDLAAAANDLAKKTSRTVYCTLGERGILVVSPAGKTELVPGITVPPPLDTVGAGDSATCGIVAALLAGASEIEAAQLGNLVASITIQQLGATGTASPSQVLSRNQEQLP